MAIPAMKPPAAATVAGDAAVWTRSSGRGGVTPAGARATGTGR